MKRKEETLPPSPNWYRHVLNVYWIIILIVLLLQSISLYTEPEVREFTIRHHLLFQGSLLVGFMGILEGISLLRPLRTDYTLLTGSSILLCTLVAFHQDIIVIPIILLVTLLFAVMSFQKSQIRFAFMLVLASYTAVLLILPDLSIRNDLKGLATITGFIVSVMLMSLMTVNRGEKILESLHCSNSANQELLVKNIIMDKLFKLDPLTELYNHKTFHEYLERLIEQHETNNLPLQLAIIDLDHFKKVNDTFGHHVGDIVLMRTAAILRGAVTPHDFVARYGGEEFTIIFTEKSLKESYLVLERIRAEMEALLHEELGFRAVTCSIGLEDYKKGAGKDFLFKNTDMSLYAAKKRGRNQISSTELSEIMQEIH